MSNQTTQIGHLAKVHVGQIGHLAKVHVGVELPLGIVSAAIGYCIGTLDLEGPVSIESKESFLEREEAEHALATGKWTQRTH